MKDIIITSQKIRRERNIYLVCFLLAFVINIAAIQSILIFFLFFAFTDIRLRF